MHCERSTLPAPLILVVWGPFNPMIFILANYTNGFGFLNMFDFPTVKQ